MKKIVILGAGISGLALGWFLKKQFGNSYHLTILEKSPRIGGWIETLEKEGFLFELGPRSFRPKGKGIETLRLIEDLELNNQVIVADAAAHHRFIYQNQQLKQLPSNFLSFVTSPLIIDIFPALIRDLFASRGKEQDESIYSFVSRRFNRQIAEKFIDPLTSGIFAGDIRKLSIRSCFPLLYELEQNYGSVFRGAIFKKKTEIENETPFIKGLKKESSLSFRYGMNTLVKSLGTHLEEYLCLNNEVVNLKLKQECSEILLQNGNVIKADYVFSTLPARHLARLVESEELSQSLQKIEATSVAVVNLGYKQKVLEYNGFGYLIPTQEKENILGVVWDSCVFPQQNYHSNETRLTVMIGGAHMKKFSDYDEDKFLKIALEAVHKHLKINVSPHVTHIKISHHAIPQYYVGHNQQVASIEKKLPQNFMLLGSSYKGVSVNDCIAEAKSLLQRFAKKGQ